MKSVHLKCLTTSNYYIFRSEQNEKKNKKKKATCIQNTVISKVLFSNPPETIHLLSNYTQNSQIIKTKIVAFNHFTNNPKAKFYYNEISVETVQSSLFDNSSSISKEQKKQQQD